MTKELRNPATKQGIVTLVNDIGEIGKALIVLIQNIDTVATALGVIFGAKVLRSILSWGFALRTSLIDAEKYMGALAVTGSRTAGVISKLIGLFRGLLGVVSAGSAGLHSVHG